MKTISLLLCTLTLVAVVHSADHDEMSATYDLRAPIHARFSRGISADGKRKRGRQDGEEPNHCRYERGPWEDCDKLTGLQHRTLKLKVNAKKMARLMSEGQCEPTKSVSRQCKPCRYAKGEWTPCENGIRHRVDEIKETALGATCEPKRNITKKCKPACRYNKSEWSSCESGIKTRTLTIIEDPTDHSASGSTSASNETNSLCTPSKTIRKVCRGGKSANMVRDKGVDHRAGKPRGGNGGRPAGREGERRKKVNRPNRKQPRPEPEEEDEDED